MVGEYHTLPGRFEYYLLINRRIVVETNYFDPQNWRSGLCWLLGWRADGHDSLGEWIEVTMFRIVGDHPSLRESGLRWGVAAAG